MSRAGIEAGKAKIVVSVEDYTAKQFATISKNLKSISYNMSMMGAGTLGTGTIGSIASGNLTNRFAEFESRILNLRTKMGFLNAMTAEQSKIMMSLETTIRELGKSTSFTSLEVADAAVHLAQAGFSFVEIESSLQAVLDLAKGTNYGLAESASMLSNAMRTFNIDTSQASVVASQFVTATRLGTLEIEDLREALKYASGSAFNLGETLPSILGLFVQMSESGLKASLAGTSLNTAMLNMVANLQKLQKQFPNFVISVDELGKVNLQQTLQDLYKITDGLTRLERVSLFQDIFNIRGARAISSTQEIERVIGFTKQIKASAGEARKASVIMDSGMKGSILRATSAFDDFVISLGKSNAELQKAALNIVPAFLMQLDKTSTAVPYLHLAIVNLPYVLAGAGLGMLAFGFTLSRVASLLSFTSARFKDMAATFRTGIKGAGAGIMAPVNAIRLGMASRTSYSAKIAKATTKVNTIAAGPQTAKNAARLVKAQAALDLLIEKRKAAQLYPKLVQLYNVTQAKLTQGFSVVYRKVATARGLLQERAALASESKLSTLIAKKSIADAGKQRTALIGKQTAKANARATERFLIVGKKDLALANAKQEYAARKAILDQSVIAEQKYVARLSKIQAVKTKLQNRNLKVNIGPIAQSAKEIDLQKRIAQTSRSILLQEQAYDNLYEVRKKIAVLEAQQVAVTNVAATTKRTPRFMDAQRDRQALIEAKLARARTVEAGLVSTVNAPDQSKLLSFYEQQLAKEQSIQRAKAATAAIDAAKIQRAKQLSSLTSMEIQAATKLSSAKIAKDSALSHFKDSDINVGNKKIALTNTVARLDAEDAVLKKRVDADELFNKKSALATRKSMAAKAAITLKQEANTAKIIAGVSKVGKGFFGIGANIRGATNIPRIFMGFLNGAKTVANFGFALTKATFTVGRFIASLNPIGLAFNIILLFGHKIPIVKDRIAELGNGFMAAGRQIASIGKLIAPAFGLITTGISAIASGEEGSVLKGITLMQSGLGLIAEIVQNRLYAAWLSFKIEISTTLNFIWDMWKAFEGMFNFASGIVEILAGNIFGDLAAGVKMLGLDQLGGGTGNMATNIMSVGTTIVTSLVNGLIDMKSWFLEGIYGLEQAVIASAGIAARFTSTSTDNKAVEILQMKSELNRGFRLKRDEDAKKALLANQETYNRSLSEGKPTDSKSFNINRLDTTNKNLDAIQNRSNNLVEQNTPKVIDPEQERVKQSQIKLNDERFLRLKEQTKIAIDRETKRMLAEAEKIRDEANKKIALEIKKNERESMDRRLAVIESDYQENLKHMSGRLARIYRDNAIENTKPKKVKMEQQRFNYNNIADSVSGYAGMVRGTVGVTSTKADTEKEQLETQKIIADNTTQLVKQGGVAY